MQLSYFSIQYYRSITDAYKLDLSDLTVLLGKNNQGKTNIIRAINLSMEIMCRIPLIMNNGKRLPRRIYDWNEDFPITLQRSKKLKLKHTSIRMDFSLSDVETAEFLQITGSLINGSLSVYIRIDEKNRLSITLPKRGRNASAMTSKITSICDFICSRFEVQYIPAVRSEDDAYNSILKLVDTELNSIDDERYRQACEYIRKKENECLKALAEKVKIPLKEFLPEIKEIELNSNNQFGTRTLRNLNYYDYDMRSNYSISIDDGVKTSLANKGDGVKSLVTMAILSQLSSGAQRLVIVDEPENHLHPEALHYIDNVLKNLSKTHQVLISTHSPIFVNRNCLGSNLIVDSGKVEKATKIEVVRNTLGIVCSDNLMDANYIVAVEGASDAAVFNMILDSDDELAELKRNKLLVVQDFGGVHNLRIKVASLNQLCCNYLLVLDHDGAAKQSVNDLLSNHMVGSDRIRYLSIASKKCSELEDFYNEDIYRDYLKSLGIDISDGVFKNQSQKWCDRIDLICKNAGIPFTKEFANGIKEKLSSEYIVSFDDSHFSKDGYKVLNNIVNYIKEDIKKSTLC